MTEPLILRRRVSELTFTLGLVLNGVAPAGETTSTVGEIFWRWEDEPDMAPELLGRAVSGKSLRVPFDLKGRDIRLFINSQTSDGRRSVAAITEAEQIVYSPSNVPVLADLTFDGGPDEVTGTIAANDGAGTIRILRQLEDDGFFEIQTVAFDETEFVDEPVIDGTYSYKLMQDGQEGESNTLSVEVTGVSGEAGSPPSDLSGVFDDVETVTLDWTNNGGTGSNVIESKQSPGGVYEIAGTVGSGTATADITEVRGLYSRTVYYRVRNESVSGYSNEISVFIPREII
jgi:hypothetical protein